jgi:hypothetical protein
VSRRSAKFERVPHGAPSLTRTQLLTSLWRCRPSRRCPSQWSGSSAKPYTRNPHPCALMHQEAATMQLPYRESRGLKITATAFAKISPTAFQNEIPSQRSMKWRGCER